MIPPWDDSRSHYSQSVSYSTQLRCLMTSIPNTSPAITIRWLST